MKSLRCLFAFALVFFVTTGCKDKGVNVADDGVTVIHVDLDKSEKVSMSDIISRIEIVELEGGVDSYVVAPRWFKVSNGNFYMDSRQTEAVYAFDSHGRLLFNTAKRQGNGRNEYLYLNGFNVDKNGCVDIYSVFSGFIRYDSLLNAVNCDESLRYTGMIPISDDVLGIVSASDDSLTFRYYSTSLHKTVGTASKAMKRIQASQFVLSRLHTYMSNNKEFLYRTCKMSDYSVFRLNFEDNSITEAYRYDLGKSTLKESFLSSINQSVGEYEKEIMRLLSNYNSIWDLHINNSFMVAVLGHRSGRDPDIEKSFCLSFYSPETGKQRLIDCEMNDGKHLYGIDQLDDGIIYTIVETSQMNNVDSMVDMELLDDNSKDILKRKNDDTNAYIIKYYLREDIL